MINKTKKAGVISIFKKAGSFLVTVLAAAGGLVVIAAGLTAIEWKTRWVCSSLASEPTRTTGTFCSFLGHTQSSSYDVLSGVTSGASSKQKQENAADAACHPRKIH